jgi:ATP-dependent DNA helicase RecQ
LLAKPLVAAKKKDIAKKQRAQRTREWEGVDEKLFEVLRTKRSELAATRGVPAYIVFSDKTLKDIALKKPVDAGQFSAVFGVGAAKQKEYADIFVAVVRNYLASSV